MNPQSQESSQQNNISNQAQAATAPIPQGTNNLVQENGQNPQPIKEKMSKKEKRMLTIGISMASLALLFFIFTVIVPLILSGIQECYLYATGGNYCSFSGIALLGTIGSIVIGAPVFLVGLSFILYALLSWKKVKNPGTTTFLIEILAILIFTLLLFFTLFLPVSI